MVYNQLNDTFHDDNNDNNDDTNDDTISIQQVETIDLYMEWYNIVSILVYNELGVELDDLPDENYRMNFENGVLPQDMAKIIIEPLSNMIYDVVNDFVNN